MSVAALDEAQRKSEEARALIAKSEFDPAIELFAASLELRCAAPRRHARPPAAHATRRAHTCTTPAYIAPD